MKDLIPKSGYYYPNRIVRNYLLALEEIVGRNGLNALLNLNNLGRFAKEFPPSNLDKEIDFGEFSTINQGMLEIYGLKGGRNLARRAGRETFNLELRELVSVAGVGTESFHALSPPQKTRIGLATLAKFFSDVSDQTTSIETVNGQLLFRINRCPVCWGQQSSTTVCFMMEGMVEESVRWFSGGDAYRVVEIHCLAAGDEACVFKVEWTANHERVNDLGA